MHLQVAGDWPGRGRGLAGNSTGGRGEVGRVPRDARRRGGVGDGVVVVGFVTDEQQLLAGAMFGGGVPALMILPST